MRLKKLMAGLLISLVLASILGCTRVPDITERGLVMAVGLDKAEDGEIELTLQVINPAGLGIVEEGSSETIQPIWINSTKGKTVFEATRHHLKTISRRPFYNHVQVFVIGEELAREGIRNILDFFSRNSEARLSPKVIIARGTTAKNIVSAKSIMEMVPAMHLKNILENNKESGFVPDLTIFDVLRDLDDNILNVTIGGAKFKDNKTGSIKDLLIEDTAVFNGDKLVGWLDPLETMGLAYIKNKINSIEIGIKDPINEENRLVIDQVHSNRKMHVKFEKDKPRAYIDIKADGIIIEQFGQTDLMAEKRLREIEKKQKRLSKQIYKK